MRRILTRCLTLVFLLDMAGCAMFGPSIPDTAYKHGRTVVESARNEIGVPYCYGGATPSDGFDCSGLVQWCYLEHGKRLPRRTEDLLHVGVPVAKEDLLPGDLVFFDVTHKRWGLHVGIYSGRGMFIHSPTRGSQVREESLYERYWIRTYIGARRVLPAE